MGPDNCRVISASVKHREKQGEMGPAGRTCGSACHEIDQRPVELLGSLELGYVAAAIKQEEI